MVLVFCVIPVILLEVVTLGCVTAGGEVLRNQKD
jgi:hypothetical protein